MPSDYRHIKRQFEKSMPLYEQNASVQDVMALKMLSELVKISDSFNNILELGVGTGLLTKRLVQNIKFQNYYANDLVEKSKNHIQKIVPQAVFYSGNALKIKPPQKMDLIISNAMFQWFENFDQAIETIKFLLNNNAILAFSTFSPENFKEITDITGLSLKYKSKEEIRTILENHGFKVLYCVNFNTEIYFKTPMELLIHLKHTGVNSLSENPWSLKKIKEFCDEFSKKYPQNKLTYSPIIVIAILKQDSNNVPSLRKPSKQSTSTPPL